MSPGGCETTAAAGHSSKAFDGPRWFDQGRPWREIAEELKANGVSALGGWGYCYGNDPAGEAQRAIETAQYGQADLLVLDVEAEFKGRPQAAEELCRRIRDALGSDYPRSPSRSSAATATAPRPRSTGTPFAGPSSSRSRGRTRTTPRWASRPSASFLPAASTRRGPSATPTRTTFGRSSSRQAREDRAASASGPTST